MQTRLTVKEDYISVDNVSLHSIPHSEVIRDGVPIPKLQELLEPTTARGDIVRARMDIAPVTYGLAEHFDVMRGDALGVRQDLRDALRDRDFVDAQIWVRRDDSAPREVDTLSGQVPAETALLAFQPLTEPANGLLRHLRRHAGEFGVHVDRDTEL